MIASLDADALRYRRLLVDPCGAPLTRSVFSGLGGSIQVRVKQYLSIHPQAVEGVYCVMPSANAYWSQYHSAASAGTSFQLSNVQQLWVNAGNTALEWRCIAGCLKVRYTGTESNRSGMISVFPVASPLYEPGMTDIRVGSTLALAPVVYRTGEVMHECKFVPTDGDQLFTDTQNMEARGWQHQGGFGVVYQGVPAGSLTLELTAIYEMENVLALPSASTVLAPQPSGSRNTLNQVLRSLGDGLAWAYSNVAAPVIKSTAQNVARSIMNSSAVTSGAGQLLLTMG